MSNILLGKPVSFSEYISRNGIEVEIEEIIAKGNDIELIGPNRTGKTALCRYIANSLESTELYEVKFIDLLHLKSPRISNAINEITGICTESTDNDELDEYIGADESSLKGLVDYTASLEKPLVVFLDEMDAGLYRKGFYHEWNASLRSLAQLVFEKKLSNISFVRIYASPPDYYEEMHMGHTISVRVGRGYVKYMPALTKENAEAYYAQLVSSSCSVAPEFAIKYTGTFPYLIECVAYEANRIQQSNVNYRDILELAYRQSASFYKDLYGFITRNDNYWKTYTSSVLSIALEQVNSCSVPKAATVDRKFDLDEMEINELCGLGVLNQGENGELVLFSPLFAWWLSRNVAEILGSNNQLSDRLVNYFGASDLKTLLTNIKNAQSVAGGIAALL